MRFFKAELIQKSVKYCFFMLLVWFLIHTAFITTDGIFSDADFADCGIVLGSKVESGGQPSIRLLSRLERGYQLFSDEKIRYLIVSGGIDPNGNNEAKVMQAYYLEKGIPAGRIFLDENGNTTKHSAVNVWKMNKELNCSSIVIITHYYHISRSKLAFRKAGFKNVYAKRGVYYFEWRDLYSHVREFIGYYNYLLMNAFEGWKTFSNFQKRFPTFKNDNILSTNIFESILNS